jgi:methyl-accepting chemotaxis protein
VDEDSTARAAAAERPAASADTRHLGLRILGQRRRFLVARRTQLRASLLAATVVLALLVLLNYSLHASRSAKTAVILAEAPELVSVLRSQDRLELLLIGVASAVFLVGAFVVTVLETHKTAGAAINLARRMGEVGAGRYGVTVRLRKDDNLKELEHAFNEMTRTLCKRAWDGAERLEEIAADADRLGAPRAAELAARLRALADEGRSRAE